MWAKDKRKTFKVHHLVLNTFIGNRPSGYQTDHIDRDRANNKLSNLEWVSPQENVNRRPYSSGENHCNSVLTFSEIKEIVNLNNEGAPLKEIAQRFNVSNSTIEGIRYGRTYKKEVLFIVNNKGSDNG